MKKLTVISAAVLAAILASGCGSGADPSSLVSDAGMSPRYAAMAKVANDQNITKQAYSVTNGLAKYGNELKNDGWSFTAVSDLSQIPKTTKTIIYINANDAAAKSQALIDFMVGFKGVVIIDSDWIDTSGKNNALISAALGSDSGDTPIANVTELKDQVATIVHGALKIGGVSPLGTTLVHSLHERILLPITFNQQGQMNGLDPKNFFKEINLQVSTASNFVAGEDKEQSRQLGDPATPDETVPTWGDNLGWRAAFFTKVWAYADASGKKYIYTEVYSGDAKNACLVTNSINCGVYPTANSELVHSTYSPGDINTVSYANSFSAQVIIGNAARGANEYGPSANAWNSNELTEKDAGESVWSQGITLGASGGGSRSKIATGGLFSIPIAYSRSKTYRKRYDTWEGFSSSGYGNLPFSTMKIATFTSGIKMKDLNNKIYSTFAGHSGSEFNQNFETDFHDKYLSGGNWNNLCGGKHNYMAKPSNGWDGFNPGVVGLVEVNKSIGWQTVSGSVGWNRAKYTFVRSPEDGFHWEVKGAIQRGGLVTGAPGRPPVNCPVVAPASNHVASVSNTLYVWPHYYY